LRIQKPIGPDWSGVMRKLSRIERKVDGLRSEGPEPGDQRQRRSLLAVSRSTIAILRHPQPPGG
jgi:hypothetical protein